jgi:hypothetical protein
LNASKEKGPNSKSKKSKLKIINEILKSQKHPNSKENPNSRTYQN